jgi:hypothetical protein
VDLHREPVALQINGAKPVNGIGARRDNGRSAPEAVTVSKNGRGEESAGAKTDEPA